MLAHVSIDPAAIAGDSVAAVLGLFIGGAGLVIVATIVAGRRELLPRDPVPFSRWVAVLAACLSLGAAAIHFTVIGDHFAEYLPYGVAFAALAWFQAGWAAAYAVKPRRKLALLAVLVNAGTLAVWTASRLVGLPIGPEPGVVEPIGLLDLTAGTLEIALTVLLAWELAAASPRLRPSLPSGGAIVFLGSSALAVVLLTSTAFAAAGGDVHDGAAHETEAPAIAASSGPAPPSIEASIAPSAAQPTPGPPSGSASAIVDSPTAQASPPPSAAIVTAPTAPRSPTPSSRRSPEPTSVPATAAPPPATPSSTTAAPTVEPGEIRFGASLDQAGAIVVPRDRFREGERAVWVAHFFEAPGVAAIQLTIVQVLTDGREFEHWREEINVDDPENRRLVAGAVLSLYVHGGEGSYRLRYLRGETLLAEGRFEFVP